MMRDYSECRHFVDHLVAEHRRLHRMLRQMRTAIVSSVGGDASPSFAEVARILGRLRDELELHFMEEDSGGGCFDEAVSRCPPLANEAKRIMAEHPGIVAEIEQLIDQANQLAPSKTNKLAIQQSFDSIYQRLRDHENAENRLFAHAFGTNVNGDEHAAPALYPHLIFDRYPPAS